jgi:hypothetical protein
MDEAGVNLAMIRLYARASKGQRAVGDHPANAGVAGLGLFHLATGAGLLSAASSSYPIPGV